MTITVATNSMNQRPSGGDRPSVAPTRIALLSPCGWGNLGDAAIMASAIEQIRARQPQAELIAFTLNPMDTELRHGIPAYALDAFTLAGFSIDRAGLTGAQRLAERALQLIRRLSCRLAVALCWLLNLITLPVREVWHWASTYRVVRSCRFVVVCGGGQVDEFWGGPWGHPYALFKFALLAQLAAKRNAGNTHFVVLSSGSAKMTSALGRWFVTRALRWADYRSFRERFAVELARDLGAQEPNSWYPDLGFSLEVEMSKRPRPMRRPTIGISPIAWLDPRLWPDKDAGRSERYFGRMVDTIRTLLARGTRVVLFATAGADHVVVADLVKALRASEIADDDLLQISPARTVPALVEALHGVDLVVASRLHGVLLSFVCDRPAVAVSYDPKVTDLMAAFGQQNACLPIETLEAAELLRAVDETYACGDEIARHLSNKVGQFRELLAEQYDRVFGSVAVEPKSKMVEAAALLEPQSVR